MMKDTLDLNQVTTCIEKGAMIAHLAEGGWDIDCDPFNETPVKIISNIKEREAGNGIVSSAPELSQLGNLPKTLPVKARKLLKASGLGRDTWSIPDTNQVIPSCIKGNFATVAATVSLHPLLKSLCEKAGLLVSSSANPCGG